MTTYCSIWGSSDRPVKNIYTCFWRCLECPIISWRNFNISAPLWDPFCKFLPFLKGWLWVCRSEEPQMMPQVYFHLCMRMQRERAGGGGVAWGWGKVKAFPHQHSFTFSLSSRLCAFARYLRVFIWRCNTKQRGAESLLTAYRCQNAAFLTLPLCGEKYRASPAGKSLCGAVWTQSASHCRLPFAWESPMHFCHLREMMLQAAHLISQHPLLPVQWWCHGENKVQSTSRANENSLPPLSPLPLSLSSSVCVCVCVCVCGSVT